MEASKRVSPTRTMIPPIDTDPDIRFAVNQFAEFGNQLFPRVVIERDGRRDLNRDMPPALLRKKNGLPVNVPKQVKSAAAVDRFEKIPKRFARRFEDLFQNTALFTGGNDRRAENIFQFRPGGEHVGKEGRILREYRIEIGMHRVARAGQSLGVNLGDFLARDVGIELGRERGILFGSILLHLKNWLPCRARRGGSKNAPRSVSIRLMEVKV